jgi:DNA-binding MarR family transcriptional regulator
VTATYNQRPLLPLLLGAAHALVDALVERLAAAGYVDIRQTDSRVFENIDPAGTRLTVLAVRAQMTHQSMGELVTSLERRGYLERRPDAADRRARLIVLTARGRAMQRVAVAEIAAIEASWFPPGQTCAGPALREALTRALTGRSNGR